MTTTTIKDLKLDVTNLDRDGIIATLIITHKMSSKNAREYYAEYHKNGGGENFVEIFDTFLLEKARTEAEVIAFLSIEGRENKLKTKSHFLSRSSFANTLRTELEIAAEVKKAKKSK